MSDGQFSVCQFFHTGKYEYVRRFVDAEEAMAAFTHYTRNPASRLGIVDRVVIVDALDHINYEWKKGVGITFPKEGQGGQDIWD